MIAPDLLPVHPLVSVATQNSSRRPLSINIPTRTLWMDFHHDRLIMQCLLHHGFRRQRYMHVLRRFQTLCLSFRRFNSKGRSRSQQITSDTSAIHAFLPCLPPARVRGFENGAGWRMQPAMR